MEFFCEAIVESCGEAEQTKEAIQNHPQQWAERGNFRAKSAATRALPFLITHPIFTVKQLCETLETSVPAANHAVNQLMKKKIIRERTGFGRNQAFAAEEVIELLTRDFGDAPHTALERAQGLLSTT